MSTIDEARGLADNEPVPHAPAVVAVKRIETHRYSFRNHSYEFACPACGRAKRYNTNFLGRRVVTCDGAKFTLIRRDA